jgi:hypothetical protein
MILVLCKCVYQAVPKRRYPRIKFRGIAYHRLSTLGCVQRLLTTFWSLLQQFIILIWSSRSLAPFLLIRILGGGVQLGPLGMSATYWPIVACPGWLWWWRIWWNEDWLENRSTRRKPFPAPLCPPQIPLDQTRDQTRAAAVGNQWLTAWAMARP